MTSVTATTSATNTSSTASAVAGTTSAADMSQQFLKLLVAQLNNQDPLNPVDNAQMTTQIAQINTVQGIQNLNTTMTSMAGQFGNLQSLQGASLIGHSIISSGNTITVDPASGTGTAAYSLAGAADNVSVQVLGAGGQVIDTLQLGAQSGGTHNFDWNASAHPGVGTPTFVVSASYGGQAVSATPLERGAVMGVALGSSGGLNLSLANGSSVPYTSVLSIQ